MRKVVGVLRWMINKGPISSSVRGISLRFFFFFRLRDLKIQMRIGTMLNPKYENTNPFLRLCKKASKQFLYYCIWYLFLVWTWRHILWSQFEVIKCKDTARFSEKPQILVEDAASSRVEAITAVVQATNHNASRAMIDEDKVTVVCVVSYMCLCGSISPHCATPLLCTLCSNYSTLQVSGSAVSHETTADQHHSWELRGG